MNEFRPRQPLDDNNPDGYRESDKDYVLKNIDLCVCMLDAYTSTPERFAFPPLEELILPRVEGKGPSPVLEVLSLAAAPWYVSQYAYAMREAGFDIPRKAESELAAALYHMMGHALKHGEAWRGTGVADLAARRDALKAST